MIHVAANKPLEPCPDHPAFIEGLDYRTGKYRKMLKAYNEWMEADQPRLPIGLKYDGDCFTEYSLTDFHNRMLELQGLGYTVPEHALEAIRDEMTDEEFYGATRQSI